MINITIDGHSGSGKSSTAKKVAAALDYTYIDTGAMYRAITLLVGRHKINPENLEALKALLDETAIKFQKMQDGSKHLFVNGEDVEMDIRTQEVADQVSEISRIPLVREHLVMWQREMAKGKGVVMEGRDAGTVILPEADLKVFMTADLQERARRRYEQMSEKGIPADLDEITANLSHRDKLDSTRDIAPLKKADGAVEVDTTHMSFEDQVDAIVTLAKQKMALTR